MSRDIECIKKENEKITKELEESKALQKKFTQQNGLIMKELGESRARYLFLHVCRHLRVADAIAVWFV